jgi:hypothetical protein
MFAKTGVAVSIAICLGAAGVALASERDGSGGYQARQGIQEPSHLSFTTDVGRAYALDESSKAKKKKAPKQVKTEPASTSGSAARAQSPSGSAAGAGSDEAARLRRYQENH